ncbi:MAG: ankyrin repeat domain-containing protein [Sphingobacteriia bacterium]|nr:ankyrin repeat domain-containing protein [Sphingobacteriia bacterium]
MLSSDINEIAKIFFKELLSNEKEFDAESLIENINKRPGILSVNFDAVFSDEEKASLKHPFLDEGHSLLHSLIFLSINHQFEQTKHIKAAQKVLYEIVQNLKKANTEKQSKLIQDYFSSFNASGQTPLMYARTNNIKFEINGAAFDFVKEIEDLGNAILSHEYGMVTGFKEHLDNLIRKNEDIGVYDISSHLKLNPKDHNFYQLVIFCSKHKNINEAIEKLINAKELTLAERSVIRTYFKKDNKELLTTIFADLLKNNKIQIESKLIGTNLQKYIKTETPGQLLILHLIDDYDLYSRVKKLLSDKPSAKTTVLIESTIKNLNEDIRVACKSLYNGTLYDENSLQNILERGGDPNHVFFIINPSNISYNNSLFLAASHRKHEIVISLLHYGAETNAMSLDKNPLYGAVSKAISIKDFKNYKEKKEEYDAKFEEYLQICETLLKNGANPNISSRHVSSPLLKLFEVNKEGKIDFNEHKEKLLNLLLKYGADPISQYYDNKKPLTLAIKHKLNISIIEKLLSHSPNIPSLTLETAINSANIEAIFLLLNKGIVPSQVQLDYIIDIAITEKSEKLLEILFTKYNVDPNRILHQKNQSLLYIALENGNKEAVELLLKYKADPNFTETETDKPIFALFKEKYLNSWECELKFDVNKKQLLNLLLEHGAKTNVNNNRNDTPLAIASIHNLDIEIIKELLNKGANPNSLCEADLRKTISHPGGQVIKLLLENGLIPNKNIAAEITKRAIKSNNQDLLKLIVIKNKVNVNTQFNDGLTPLYTATIYERIEMVKFLLENKANPNVISKVYTKYNKYENIHIFKLLKKYNNSKDISQLEEWLNLFLSYEVILDDEDVKLIKDFFYKVKDEEKLINLLPLILSPSLKEHSSNICDSLLMHGIYNNNYLLCESLITFFKENNLHYNEFFNFQIAIITENLTLEESEIRLKICHLFIKNMTNLTNINIESFLPFIVKYNKLEILNDINKYYQEFLIKNCNNSLIYLAIKNNNKEMVETLLKYGIPILSRNEQGLTPYEYAVEQGYEEIAELLSPNPNNQLLNDNLAISLEKFGKNYRGLLLKAIENNNFNQVEPIISIVELYKLKLTSDFILFDTAINNIKDSINKSTEERATSFKILKSLFQVFEFNTFDYIKIYALAIQCNENTLLHFIAGINPSNLHYDLFYIAIEFNNIEAVKSLLTMNDININYESPKYNQTIYEYAKSHNAPEILALFEPLIVKKEEKILPPQSPHYVTTFAEETTKILARAREDIRETEEFLEQRKASINTPGSNNTNHITTSSEDSEVQNGFKKTVTVSAKTEENSGNNNVIDPAKNNSTANSIEQNDKANNPKPFSNRLKIIATSIALFGLFYFCDRVLFKTNITHKAFNTCLNNIKNILGFRKAQDSLNQSLPSLHK